MACPHTVSVLDSILRGEISAIETYQQAMAKVTDEPGAHELRKIHQEHIDSANTLREHIRTQGGEPSQGSGPWGSVAKAIEGTAKLFGEQSALAALKTGEEHGLKDYEKALQDSKVQPECAAVIRSTLLPRTQGHIATLDRLIAAVTRK